VLSFEDPDGLVLELVATAASDPRTPASHPDIPVAYAIRGFHGITLAVTSLKRTARVLTQQMGHRQVGAEDTCTRFTTGSGAPGSFVDLRVDPLLPRGLQGAGTVHHVAFRTANLVSQASDRATLLADGYNVSPVM